MKIVLVESPAKAKTINKYLGKDYEVLATVGHIRNLLNKNGVDPEKDFSMNWEILDKANKFLKQIKESLRDAEKLILATDPDREGESISWHVLELLEQKKLLDKIPVERIVFHEITKNSVIEAIQHPRSIDSELVNASLARNALDYLIGFKLSPVLWQKLPGAKSAGRVQSVALRLVCERESSIETFNPEEYWSIDAKVCIDEGSSFNARLIILKGKKLNKLSISNENLANEALSIINSHSFKVSNLKNTKEKRNPKAPFTTSTLQQEASKNLGFSASRTMKAAQKLYEGLNIGSETTGLITYMRTDSVQLSKEAINQTIDFIKNEYGDKFCSKTIRIYKSKVANAQEAHEAIRPTLLSREPQKIKSFLDNDTYKIYNLIWQRTIASQMSSAIINKTVIEISNSYNSKPDEEIVLRANGSNTDFLGYLKVYKENKTIIGNDEDNEKLENTLPKVKLNDKIILLDLIKDQHFTQPEPRYTDASLIKKLEELGIGRPSTYASILEKIQNRGYVFKSSNRYFADDRGRIVTTFLTNYFEKYVEYSFTADLEEKLDEVSEGKLNWKEFLSEFWKHFKVAVENTTEIKRTDVVETIEKVLSNYLFETKTDGSINRDCPKCENGLLSLKLGKFGSFIACSNYPECKFTRQISKFESSNDENGISGLDEKTIGIDSSSNETIYLKNGPYGLYLQLGTDQKPKRISIPKNIDVNSIDLSKAIALINLPRELGIPAGENKQIVASIGRYGPYIKFGSIYVSLPQDDTVLTIGLNHANDLIQDKISKSPPIINLGSHPEGGAVEIKSGRFGSYVQYKNLRASIPKNKNTEDYTLDMAINLIKDKGKAPKTKRNTRNKK